MVPRPAIEDATGTAGEAQQVAFTQRPERRDERLMLTTLWRCARKRATGAITMGASSQGCWANAALQWSNKNALRSA